jgi:predicted Rossmann-fold nucleotide-binding protein
VLAGSEYWNPLLAYLRDVMVSEGTISAADLGLFQVSDDPVEIAAILSRTAKAQFGLRERVSGARWWLFEHALSADSGRGANEGS